MQKVIIVGYPKSGNTWLCRLTAELLNCPVKGFLYSDHFEIASEGLNRSSLYEVYKSHHQYHEISAEDRANAHIIYILRDPRDVSISGRKYFKYNLDILQEKESQDQGSRNKLIFKLKSFINSVYKSLFAEGIKRRRMNKAVLEGNAEVHHWCRISWKEHLSPFAEEDRVLKVSYEALLDSPLNECQRILEHVGETRDQDDIEQAIARQSYSATKERFIESDKKSKADFLRRGEKEQWRTAMSKKEKDQFLRAYENEFLQLGYPLR